MKTLHAFSARRTATHAPLLFAALALSSCCTPHMLHDDSARTDTVLVTQHVRDTFVRIEPDRALLRALVECDSLGQVRLRQLLDYRAGERLAPPRIDVRDNILTAMAEVDSLSIYLQLRDRYEVRSSQTVRQVVRTVEVNRLTGWQRTWIRIGQTLAVVVLLIAVFKLRRFLRR